MASDSIGFHADDEPELGTNPIIGSMSLGAERKFVLKHPASGEKTGIHAPAWQSVGHGRHKPAPLAAWRAEDEAAGRACGSI